MLSHCYPMITLRSHRLLSTDLFRATFWSLNRCFSSTKIIFEPLRILFCGSDDFSIASLRKLFDAQQVGKDLISSIDVVCRPGKRVGRGLKAIREGSYRSTPQSDPY